jgi:hypothetical protein
MTRPQLIPGPAAPPLIAKAADEDRTRVDRLERLQRQVATRTMNSGAGGPVVPSVKPPWLHIAARAALALSSAVA